MDVLKNFEKLDKLAVKHFECKCDISFNEMYAEAARLFKRANRAKLLISGFRDINDADEIFDYAILKVVRKGAPDGFGKQLAVALKNRRLNFIKTETRRLSRITLCQEREDSDDEPTKEIIVADVSAEEDLFRRKKEANQRQLIDFLKNDPRQVDPTTTLIVEEFPQHESITALAKALGLHHEVVKRKLRRLSRFYDSNRFGDIYDNLAV